jgi:hypothetical protein
MLSVHDFREFEPVLKRALTSVAEPEPQEAALYGRSRNAMRLQLRRFRLRQWY